jgi:hypothetical protein
MPTLPQFVRPTFEQALTEWKTLLRQRGFPTDLTWIFDENLIFEKDANGQDHLSFQSQLTPPPTESERVAFNYFSDFEARIVFYRIGSARGKSVCLMLCDTWFETKQSNNDFVRRDDWLISFHAGDATELEEVVDQTRWQQRMIRNRPLHDLDFSMTLRAVHEILAHGRVLTPYEHFALRLLHGWSQPPGQFAK